MHDLKLFFLKNISHFFFFFKITIDVIQITLIALEWGDALNYCKFNNFFRFLFAPRPICYFKNIKYKNVSFQFSVAIELIVQHIRDFLNNRGRSIDPEIHPIVCNDDLDDLTVASGENGNDSGSASGCGSGNGSGSGSVPGTPKHGKKKNETHSHSMHRPH